MFCAVFGGSAPWPFDVTCCDDDKGEDCEKVEYLHPDKLRKGVACDDDDSVKREEAVVAHHDSLLPCFCSFDFLASLRKRRSSVVRGLPILMSSAFSDLPMIVFISARVLSSASRMMTSV